MPKKTIREVTALTGITEKALRYYDDRDVIHPTEKSPYGRREWLYDDETVERLHKLVEYKRMGLQLDTIRKLLNEIAGEWIEIEVVLREHLIELREELESKVEQIELTEKEIEKVRGKDEED